MPVADATLERVLNEVIGGRMVVHQGSSVAAQGRYLRLNQLRHVRCHNGLFGRRSWNAEFILAYFQLSYLTQTTDMAVYSRPSGKHTDRAIIDLSARSEQRSVIPAR